MYEEIIKAAGRPNPKWNAAAKRLGRLSKGLWIVTAVVIIWDVSTAPNKIETLLRDLAEVAVGIVGSMVVGAAVGLAFGPIGAIIGGIIGGILGSLIAHGLLDWLERHAPTPEQADAMMRAMN